MTRLLVIMGSGETSPTMVKTHKEVFERLGPGPVPAVLLDTPFGFQENADDIAHRASHYFCESVGRDVLVASFRSSASIGTFEHEKSLVRLREAKWVFAGPGSPTYALRTWSGSGVPGILREKLQRGGAITFASAAALTLGCLTVPVYEVYKVGMTPEWREGLDLLAEAGLKAAVIPHYNNAEGGNHDTRFCYLGERRLSMLEKSLPDDTFVLGIDEHTALILDLDAGKASIQGMGVLTVRHRDGSAEIPSGSTLPISELEGAESTEKPVPKSAAPPSPGPRASPLLTDVRRVEDSFREALLSGKAADASAAILQLDDTLVGWSDDTLQSDEMDRARATLRSMIVRLGEAAEVGLRDPRDLLAPIADAVLELRGRMREEHKFDVADALRDVLVNAGIEVRDGPSGTDWSV